MVTPRSSKPFDACSIRAEGAKIINNMYTEEVVNKVLDEIDNGIKESCQT